MSLRPWRRRGEPERFDFGIFRIDRFRARSPRTGSDRTFTTIETRDWVNVIALTPSDEIVLVRQYRHGRGDFSLEIPGGVVDDGETPRTAAERELREETGHAGAEPVPLGVVEPNPAILSNRCHTFLVRGARPVGEIAPDPGEDLEVVKIPRPRIAAAVADGRITHALVVCGFWWWRERFPEDWPSGG